MSKSFTAQLEKAKAEARAEEYAEFRATDESINGARIGLAAQAIKQRIDQDLAIAIAAFEIDTLIENPTFRVHSNPADGLSDVMALVARRDACVALIEQYRPEVEELYAKQMAESPAASWGAEVEDEGTDEVDAPADEEVSGDE